MRPHLRNLRPKYGNCARGDSSRWQTSGEKAFLGEQSKARCLSSYLGNHISARKRIGIVSRVQPENIGRECHWTFPGKKKERRTLLGPRNAGFVLESKLALENFTFNPSFSISRAVVFLCCAVTFDIRPMSLLCCFMVQRRDFASQTLW